MDRERLCLKFCVGSKSIGYVHNLTSDVYLISPNFRLSLHWRTLLIKISIKLIEFPLRRSCSGVLRIDTENKVTSVENLELISELTVFVTSFTTVLT